MNRERNDDKEDDFDFWIVNFPYMCYIPAAHISPLEPYYVLFNRYWMSVTDDNISIPLDVVKLCLDLFQDFSLHFYVPATKWSGHIVLPMSIIPK